MTLITTTEGKTCGGYTSISWQSSSGVYEKDSNAFLFSLDSSNKYTCSGKGKGDVYHSSSFGSWFGDQCLGLFSPGNLENAGMC